jgi:hypothetical protein
MIKFNCDYCAINSLSIALYLRYKSMEHFLNGNDKIL